MGHDWQQPLVDNNRTMSVVGILLFPPLGLLALVSANRVNPLLRQGEFAQAQAAVATSRTWSRLAVLVGLAVWTIGCACCTVLAVKLGIRVFE
ncbi:CD225/dispanin family protein [Catellatospora sp. KI3]|uniref:CD225/dispanin family protein n=1 Tax=Catellatospora sp. KI3 TaxID=3041620 RepID=UPI002482CD62|nr:CD225/dispanin family protein [Catellatospora sp. KI3]MDI1460357.1 CD225/dispanin family protein [Catellatospora sp. KI3]